MESGALLRERVRVPTPEVATPDEMVVAAIEVISRPEWDGPVGYGFPGVVKEGVIHTAANVANQFIGFNLADPASEGAGDAGTHRERRGCGRARRDALGRRTRRRGDGPDVDDRYRHRHSALYRGQARPKHTELGHIELHGREAELWAADRVRKVEDLSWKKWSKRIGEYLQTMETLLWPDLIIVGGGVSKKAEKFLPRIETRTRVVPAEILNTAGIAGAALAYVPEAPVSPRPPASTTQA